MLFLGWLTSVATEHIEDSLFYKQAEFNNKVFVKVALLETNPYLLGLTIVVSIVHSIFEFLAFKNGKVAAVCTQDFT